MCFLRDALSVNTFAQDSRWHTNCFGADELDGLEPDLLLLSPERFPSRLPSTLPDSLRPPPLTKVNVFLAVRIILSPVDLRIPLELRRAC